MGILIAVACVREDVPYYCYMGSMMIIMLTCESLPTFNTFADYHWHVRLTATYCCLLSCGGNGDSGIGGGGI